MSRFCLAKLEEELRGVSVSASEPLPGPIEAASYVIDAKCLTKVRNRAEREMAKVLARIHALVGFALDPNSHEQVEAYLYDQLGLKVYKILPDGSRATDDDTIDRLMGHRMVTRRLLRYRELSRIVATCCAVAGQIDEEGRLRLEPDQRSAFHDEIPAREALGELPSHDEFGLRRGLRARKGHQIVIAEYRQLNHRA